MDSKAKESKCACNFALANGFQRSDTSNLGDFVEDFWQLKIIFSSLLIGITSDLAN